MEEAEVQLQLESATGSRIDQSTRSGINQAIRPELIIIQEEHRDKQDVITHESVTAKIAIFSPTLTEYPLSHSEGVIHVIPALSLSEQEIKNPAVDVCLTLYYP